MVGQFGFLRRDTSSCEYACWDVGCGVVGGLRGRVTMVMDDPAWASSGVPHTITKGVASSIGLNKEAVETYHQKMEGVKG